MRELPGRYIECRRAANQQASSREEEVLVAGHTLCNNVWTNLVVIELVTAPYVPVRVAMRVVIVRRRRRRRV